ncbi:MAG: DUF6328 family protein [Actinomycetota bacterium]|nr:DUF6328 family protein [Actinomycetota bacterium]
MADQSTGEPGETEKERVNRELIELLNELRVVLPGVQVLFAFLLTVPFSNGFPKMTSLQRDVYFVAFVCATIATLLLIAPTTYHRLLFRQGNKERILFEANKMVIAGTAFLALAMAAAVFVITDVLFHAVAAGIASGLAAGASVALWYGLPLYRRLQDRRRG